MEFVNRKACIEHYQEQFPRLPRYMVEMALDYDLSNGGESNEKPVRTVRLAKGFFLARSEVSSGSGGVPSWVLIAGVGVVAVLLAAIATLIFIVVGAMAWLNLKLSKVKV